MSTVEETTPRTPAGESTVLPLLPLTDTVVFPSSLTPLAIGQERSIRLVDEAVAGDQTIAVVTSRAGEEEERRPEDL
jgi:ATP-dependent Lon protease